VVHPIVGVFLPDLSDSLVERQSSKAGPSPMPTHQAEKFLFDKRPNELHNSVQDGQSVDHVDLFQANRVRFLKQKKKTRKSKRDPKSKLKNQVS